MSDLLVGCRCKALDREGEGVIVKAASLRGEDLVWVLALNGRVKKEYVKVIKIHEDDVKFIFKLSKNYKLREQILTNKINRFEILDL